MDTGKVSSGSNKLQDTQGQGIIQWTITLNNYHTNVTLLVT